MSPDDFRRLAAAGLSTDQIALVMDIMAANEAAHAEADEKRKADQRARWRKWKQGQKETNVSQREQMLVNNSRDRVTRVEDNNSTPQKEPLEEKQTAQARGSADLAAFKAELAPHVDAERIEAYVKHRRSKRGQNTAYAARLFLGDAAACGLSPAAAIDACISRNWITVKPEYLRGRNGTGPPPKPENTTDVAKRLLAEMGAQNGQPGTSFERHHQTLVALPGGKHAGTG